MSTKPQGHNHAAPFSCTPACPSYGQRPAELPTGREIAEAELVNHPRHYNSHPSGVECWDIVEELTFNTGTAIKHLWRAGLKPGNDVLIDLRKARSYIEREIRRLEKVRGTSGPAS